MRFLFMRLTVCFSPHSVEIAFDSLDTAACNMTKYIISPVFFFGVTANRVKRDRVFNIS